MKPVEMTKAVILKQLRFRMFAHLLNGGNRNDEFYQTMVRTYKSYRGEK